MEHTMPPTTTEQEDLTHAGQRRINLIWEYTQASVAILVVLTNMIAGLAMVFGYSKEVQYPSILANSLFLIVGFYFSRTNHAAIGGVGVKPTQEYRGR